MAASTVHGMRMREDLGPTDVARANGEVLGGVASLLARGSGLVSLVIVAFFATLASRGEEAGLSGHALTSLIVASARGLGMHLVLMSVLLLVVVMLGSMFLWRRILVPGRPGAFIRFLDEARRSILRANCPGDLAASHLLRVDRCYERDITLGGVLEQLRQSLILSPLAPPELNRSTHRVVSDQFLEVAPAR